MLFDNEKEDSRRRSGDEFLRRMRCEEFLSRQSIKGDIPTFGRSDIPRRDERPRTSCNGDDSNERGTSFTHETQRSGCDMPSLAMVYSPYQSWQSLLSPKDGLAHGSIFAELIKPFEAGNRSRGTEGGCCK